MELFEFELRCGVCHAPFTVQAPSEPRETAFCGFECVGFWMQGALLDRPKYLGE